MPRVLVITRTFPPTGSVGSSIRLVKFIKYLSLQEWDFDVVTQDPDHPAVLESEKSFALTCDIPDRVNIYFSRSLITIPDRVPLHSFLRYISAVIWAPSALCVGHRLVSRNNIDLIYAGMPHFVNGVIAAVLSIFTGIPLVLDMKDDVVGGSVYHHKSGVRKAFERFLERLIFDTASQISFVTQQSLNSYRARYPQKQKQFHYIPNGCDLEEFAVPPINEKDCGDSFVILSAASRFRTDYRDAKPFLHAVAYFLNQHPEAREKVQVIFLGNSLSHDYDSLISELEIEGIVRNEREAERDAYRSWLASADLLFLVQPHHNFTSIAGTLYEYWATGRAPILLFSEKGASRDIVEKYQLGMGIDFEDIQSGAQYIERVYVAKQQGFPIRISVAGIDAFDRKRLAREVGRIWELCFNSTLSSKSPKRAKP